MSTAFLPCSVYHEDYAQDHAWWQTRFVKAKMILLCLLLFGQVANSRTGRSAECCSTNTTCQ